MVIFVTIQSRTFCLLPKGAEIRTYKTTVLSVVLYGYETSSLILRGNMGSGYKRTEC
jgi:hypothetical protein